MKLDDIVAADNAIDIRAIGGDPELTLRIQNRLAQLGLLDPPADERFGPVSVWALTQFLARAFPGTVPSRIGAQEARALLDPASRQLFPLKDDATSFAGRVVKAMVRRGDWICRHPDCINIAYVDGTDPDGTPNENMHNKFEDVRLVIRVQADGEPVLEAAWDATTEPGTYYVKTRRLSVLGAAHIVAGQYKAWSVGMHHASSPDGHEALVQTADIRITRDLDENFDPAGDKIYVGIFGINQHWGFDIAQEDVRNASAGCLVGRTRTGHRQFMALCKADARYGVNHGYRFMTSVLPPELVHAEH